MKLNNSDRISSQWNNIDGQEGTDHQQKIRVVYLPPVGQELPEEDEGVNANVFRNLDSPVSEGGENFSTG